MVPHQRLRGLKKHSNSLYQLPGIMHYSTMSQARSASGDPKNEAHLRQGTYSFILLRALKCVESCSEKQARGQSSEMERSGALLGEGETCKRGRVKEYSSLLRTFFK